MSASSGPSAVSPVDQTFLQVAHVKQATKCQACMLAILPAHVRVGLVRQVVTARFPCVKAHWFHPLCLPSDYVDAVQQHGSFKGKSIGVTADAIVGIDTLSPEEREAIEMLIPAWVAHEPVADAVRHQCAVSCSTIS